MLLHSSAEWSIILSVKRATRAKATETNQEENPMTTNETYGKELKCSFPSLSDPSRSYAVQTGKDGVIYCSCPAWKFQRLSPRERTCKHTLMAKALFLDALKVERVEKKAKKIVRLPARSGTGKKSAAKRSA